MAILKGYLYIPERQFNEELRKTLTIKNPLYVKKKRMGLDVSDLLEKFILYEEIETKQGLFYRVPRYVFGNFTATKNRFPNLIVKTPNVPIEINWREGIKARDGSLLKLNWSQEATIKSSYNTLIKDKAALIVAQTGEGKTTMAIKLITMLKQKTLILCHKNSLIKQWREELLHLTDLKESDIGLLQQGKFKDGKVVLGSQASLWRETIGRHVNELFGLKIQDETHIVGAEKFLASYARFNSTYDLALSATPEREDGLHKMYFFFTSPNIIGHKSVRAMKSDYTMIPYRRKKPWKRYPPFIPQNVQLQNNLSDDEDRTKFVADLIIKNKDRKMLVVSNRVKQLNELMSLIAPKLPGKKVFRFYGEETKTVRKKVCTFVIKKDIEIFWQEGANTTIHADVIKIWRGNDNITLNITSVVHEGVTYKILKPMHYVVNAQEQYDNRDTRFVKYMIRKWRKKKISLDEYEEPELADLHKSDVILATLQKFKDALNFPHLDLLIPALPFSSRTTFIQLKGRIERLVKGKLPLILDIDDRGNFIAERMTAKRISIYEEFEMTEVKY